MSSISQKSPRLQPNPTAHLADILRTLAMLFGPSQVTELRALEVNPQGDGRPYTMSGYFDDLDRLAQAAERVTRRAKGVYVVFNVMDPALLARANNHIKGVGREAATADTHILRRCWLLIDADPVRPSGISSTDAEHAAGLARVQDIRTALREAGWPEGALADSGNGGHGLYRIDLPNDAASRQLVKEVLQALAFSFDDAAVTVDQSVINAAQLGKLYGTIVRKGDSTRDRPHRTSQLLEVPDVWTAVTLEQLQALARQRPESGRDPRASPRRGPGAAFDLDQWIAAHALEVDGPVPWQGGRKWLFPVCPWNQAHRPRKAYIVQLASGAMQAGCMHNSCAGHDWHALRDLVEPGWQTPRPTQQAARLKAGSAAANGTGTPTAEEEAPANGQEPGTRKRWPPLSDQYNAELFVEAHGANLHYCERWKRWLTWTGQRWVVDEIGQVMRWAKATIIGLGEKVIHIPDESEQRAFLKHIQRSLDGPAGASVQKPTV